jgi:hypothetical protein
MNHNRKPSSVLNLISSAKKSILKSQPDDEDDSSESFTIELVLEDKDLLDDFSTYLKDNSPYSLLQLVVALNRVSEFIRLFFVVAEFLSLSLLSFRFAHRIGTRALAMPWTSRITFIYVTCGAHR